MPGIPSNLIYFTSEPVFPLLCKNCSFTSITFQLALQISLSLPLAGRAHTECQYFLSFYYANNTRSPWNGGGGVGAGLLLESELSV